MAQFKSIKSAKEAGIPGIEFVKTDNAITEVIVGGKLRIRKGESYAASLQVLVDQPYEEANRFRVTAKHEAFDPKVTYHEGRYDADSAAREFERLGAEAKVEEVTALLDDNGEVAGIVGEPTAQEREDVPAF